MLFVAHELDPTDGNFQNLNSALNDAHLMEETYWKEKANVKWLREGAYIINTKYFHSIVMQRRQRNFFAKLKNDEGKLEIYWR